MVKRLASVLLWFIATGWAFNYLSLILGTPSILGLVLAGGVSAFVGVDPKRLFWPVTKVEANRSPVVATSVQRPVRSSY